MAHNYRVKAKDLKFNKSQLLEIDRSIRDLLSTIDDEIKKNHDGGIFTIKYKLISAFDVPNMTSSNARMKIYSSIISDLSDRGFLVRYRENNNRYYLIIKWITDEEILKKDNEINILNFFSLPIKQQMAETNKPSVCRYEGINNLMHETYEDSY